MYLAYNQEVKSLTPIVLAGFFLLFGCSSSRLAKFDNRLAENRLQNSFHGLVVMDAKTKKVLYDTHGDKYFTPASNTKIVTLYTGLKMLPEHFPTLKYLEKNDSIFVVPTGDPSWLHPFLQDSTGVQFLNGKLYSNDSIMVSLLSAHCKLQKPVHVTKGD